MKIVLWPNPVLKLKSAEVTEKNIPDYDFFSEMFRTMDTAGGVGLSAIQVSLPIRMFVLRTPENGSEVIFNPVIVNTGKERALLREGCLSTPGLYDEVLRYREVEVRYQTAEQILAGKTEPPVESWHCSWTSGLRAQVIQHEIEHLDGKMYVDHLPAASRSRILGAMMKMKRSGKR
jgi:peptide deformylase